MATRRVLDRAVRRLRMTAEDIDDLAAKLLTTKRRVYRRTLQEEATKLGYRDVGLPVLSAEVMRGLDAEARDHANRIAQTFNSDLADQAAAMSELPNDDVEPQLRTWVNARQRKRAKPTAITEAYTAHSDATMSLFLDLGMADEVDFDFGTHPDDSAPVCDICIALVRGNPWTLGEVITIGNPHIACRQSWHVRGIEQRDLPAELPPIGQTFAGVAGKDPLLNRHDNRRADAAAFVAQLSE